MKTYSFFLITIIFFSCGESEFPLPDKTNNAVIVPEKETAITSDRAEKIALVIETLPPPLETATMFQNSRSKFDPSILNPVENVPNYSTNNKRAINFGIYGADISYINLFEQTQESVFYLHGTKMLADELGISNAFTPIMMERLEENIDNRDSIIKILQESFVIIDAYLTETDQDNLSALIITGGWIEGIHLGVRMIQELHPDEELARRIAFQKFSLEALLDLLETYEDPAIKKLVVELQDLKSIYSKIEVVGGKEIANSDKIITAQNKGVSLKYNMEMINEIGTKIENIRNRLISVN